MSKLPLKPFRSCSSFAQNTQDDNKVFLANLVFYSSERKPVCPWTDEPTVIPLEEVHLLVPQSDGRTLGHPEGSVPRWEVSCQRSGPPGKRPPRPDRCTGSETAATCYECRKAAGLPVPQGHELPLAFRSSEVDPASLPQTTLLKNKPSPAAASSPPSPQTKETPSTKVLQSSAPPD